MSEWISIKEQLPIPMMFTPGKGWSQRVDVLFCDAKGRMSVGYRRCENLVMAKPIGEVTHWMPLPERPRP